MSFLALDDDCAALADALRFIDEFALLDDPSESLPESSPLTETPGCSTNPASGSLKHPKRVRDPAVYARHRSKQKTELLQLRDEVQKLERQLNKSRRALGLPLLQATPLASDSDAGTASQGSYRTAGSRRRAKRLAALWLAVAMREQRRRQAAEQVNKQLRQALAAQTAASRSLVQLTDHYSSTTAMEIELQLNRYLLYTRAVRMRPPRSVSSDSVASDVSVQLHMTAQRLVLEAVMSVNGAVVGAVSHEHNIKHDPAVGAYAETQGAAPLGRELAHVGTYLQHTFWKSKFSPLVAKEPDEKTTIREKHDFVDVEIQGASVRFSGASLILKQSETDRLVFTHSTLFFHPSGKLCLREGGWFIVQRSPVNPSGESIYLSRSRIAPSAYDGVTELDGLRVGHVQSAAVAALGKQTELRYQAVQRRLLVATGRGDLAGLISDDDPFANETVVFCD